MFESQIFILRFKEFIYTFNIVFHSNINVYIVLDAKS